ncbi:hypothetical protein B0H15DRAFT_376543 [Mycena belliarum]|uniref:Uncharacterized protein n=1 Tax=Mycena belliarum TaxID=1033014 RepID=A0AAD6U4H9_9AGAR|nr:hypothetical protein B0H15DRAFT_376543 [Mycena belliae]
MQPRICITDSSRIRPPISICSFLARSACVLLFRRSSCFVLLFHNRARKRRRGSRAKRKKNSKGRGAFRKESRRLGKQMREREGLEAEKRLSRNIWTENVVRPESSPLSDPDPPRPTGSHQTNASSAPPGSILQYAIASLKQSRLLVYVYRVYTASESDLPTLLAVCGIATQGSTHTARQPPDRNRRWIGIGVGENNYCASGTWRSYGGCNWDLRWRGR